MMGIKDEEPILGCEYNFLSLDKVRLIQTWNIHMYSKHMKKTCIIWNDTFSWLIF
jgi:hypothetical protein